MNSDPYKQLTVDPYVIVTARNTQERNVLPRRVRKTNVQGGPCLRSVCDLSLLSLFVHVYVYTFPLARFQISFSSHSQNVWAPHCLDSVRFL